MLDLRGKAVWITGASSGLGEALAELVTGPTQRSIAVTFDDGYSDFLPVVECLADIGARATLYVSTNHVGDRQLIPEAGRLLTWKELATIPTSTVEIGSHAHRHRPMDVLSSAAVLDEATTSRAAILHHLGRASTSFCYPHGYTSRRVQRQIAAAGYTSACIVGRRVATSSDSLFALPRLQVRDHMSAQEVIDLVNVGEPGIAPKLKPALQPAWRAVRYASRAMGTELS